MTVQTTLQLGTETSTVLLAGQLKIAQLFRFGWSDIRQKFPFACTESLVIGPRLGEAQRTIRPSPHQLCFIVVLAIVMPEADLTNLIVRSFIKRE